MARFILGLILLLAAVALVAQTLRSELETLGHAFVGYASYPGMAAGTLLADGFFFPVPPQFYMLLAIASNSSDAVALLSISMGSVLGGISGFFLAKRLSRIEWLRARFTSARALRRLRGSVGMKSMVALSATPIAFSWLIYFCGMCRYPPRFMLLLCALRVPKLALYYWLVRTGWYS